MRLNKPLTMEEAKRGDLIPDGIYDFEVISANDEVSRAGNDMIKVQLKLYMPDGRERFIYDYLLESMEFKLAHFFESIGNWEKYESGEFSAHDCYGSGQVKIYTQKSKDPQYSDKSAVADYMLSDEQTVAKSERKTKAVGADFVDSELPF